MKTDASHVNMPTKYPTKEEILRDPIIFGEKTIELMKDFKTHWIILRKHKANEQKKQKLIEQLLLELNTLYCGKQLWITFINSTETSYYQHLTKTIVLKDLSIITALHEFRHHLGYGEIDACRFSVQLFQQTFPRSYAKLVWEGHMLKKPN